MVIVSGHGEVGDLERLVGHLSLLRRMLERQGFDHAGSAYQVGMDQLYKAQRPDLAEPLFREALASLDPVMVARASLELGRIREYAHGDFAGARQFYTQALIYGSSRSPDFERYARTSAERAEARFQHAEAPRQVAATTPPMSVDEAPGSATPEQVAAARERGTLPRGTGSRDQHRVAIVGTLVRDEHGRFGVRDETTGKTTLVDFAWSREWVETEAVRDLGQGVRVTGSVGSLDRPTSLMVSGYHATRDLQAGDANMRLGVRFLDVKSRDLAGREVSGIV